MSAVSSVGGRASALGEVALAPGPDGGIGAFSLRGPFGARPSPGDVDGKRAVLATAKAGFVDVKTALGVGAKGESYAVATAALVTTRPWEGFLLIGGDDEVAVSVAGKEVLASRGAHPALEDVEIVPLSLPAGRTSVDVRLHTWGGPWELRVRLVERDLSPARDLTYLLPTDLSADEVGQRLLQTTLDRNPSARGWSPVLHLRVTNGFPRAAAAVVTVAAQRRGRPEGSLFRLSPGGIPSAPSEPASDLAVMLPAFFGADADELEQGAWTLSATVVGKTQTFGSLIRPEVRRALAKIASAKAKVVTPSDRAHPPSLVDTTVVASLEHLASRLVSYASGEDRDGEAQADDARRAEAFADAVLRDENPFHTLRGGIRVAHRSPQDGKPSPFALYVPEGAPLDGSVKLPLVVALHALNGKPMNMLRWVFGRDEDGRDGEWEDRHPGTFPRFPAIVIAPMAHFNTGFRDLAEVDVVQIIAWTRQLFPIDETRISITGPSMGGIGAGGIGLRHAGLFAASAPLCGYHTYFLRNDMRPVPKTPWEQALGEHRSNASWAENGLYLPMTIFHGTKDTPVENSGVLIDRYQKLGYRMIHEHPDEGHHVWPRFYDGLVGLRWLTSQHRPKSPTKIVWKTDAHRYDGAAWLRVTKLDRTLSWGEVTATAHPGGGGGESSVIDLAATGVRGLHLERDGASVAGVVTVQIAGKTLRFEKDEPVDLVRKITWEKGAVDLAGQKRKGAEGPLRDILHDPLVFVVGTQDPALVAANRLVAQALAKVRPGVLVDYPVVDDRDLDQALLETHSAVLVGGPEANLWTAKIDARLPLHVRPGRVVLGDKILNDPELAAVFIFPSPFADPKEPRTVVVAAGASLAATLRIPALPELLPDWVVFDRGVLPAKGQQLLTPGTFVAAGMFDEAWQLIPAP